MSRVVAEGTANQEDGLFERRVRNVGLTPDRIEQSVFLDQLTGTKYNLATLFYYRRFGNMPTQIGRGIYAGFSAETGRINDVLMKDPWDWSSSAAVFWGADTILGTLVIGYGYSSLGQGNAYLTIGHNL